MASISKFENEASLFFHHFINIIFVLYSKYNGDGSLYKSMYVKECSKRIVRELCWE